MITATTTCKFCGSDQLICNGSVKGRPKYRCKTCARSGYFDDRLTPRLERYAQVEKLLTEGISLRGIVRATGVSRMTVAKLLKKSLLPTSAND